MNVIVFGLINSMYGEEDGEECMTHVQANSIMQLISLCMKKRTAM